MNHVNQKQNWIFAPHPDDELLGVGGIMAKNPNDFFVIYICDGGGSKSSLARDDDERNEIIKKRKKNSILGLEILGITSHLHLNHKEIKSEHGRQELFKSLSLLFDKKNPLSIFVPSPYEFKSKNVSDVKTHRIVTEIVIEFLRKLKKSVRLYGYEVWDEIPKGPDVIIEDISEKIDLIKAAITVHETEKKIDFIRMKEGRAKTISVTSINEPLNFLYGERFLDMSCLLENKTTLEDYRLFRERNSLEYNPQFNLLSIATDGIK